MRPKAFRLCRREKVMKILCDVCKREEAAIFCCADEAALCGTCDDHVHQANELASKHRRLSLLHPLSSPQFPLCDVCQVLFLVSLSLSRLLHLLVKGDPTFQEKRAFVFCKEDRALICSDCDSSIHSANDLTMKHARFLFSGISLSLSGAPVKQDTDKLGISDYLFEELRLPGWPLEDFLQEQPSVIHPTKMEEEDLIWFPEEDVDDGSLFSAIRVPPEGNNRRRRRRLSDDGFTVPELAAGESRRRQKRQTAVANSLMPGRGDSPFLSSVFFF